MEITLNKYADKIGRNEVNPHVRYDGQDSGLVLDPQKEDVSLEILGFGIYRLGPEFVARNS